MEINAVIRVVPSIIIVVCFILRVSCLRCHCFNEVNCITSDEENGYCCTAGQNTSYCFSRLEYSYDREYGVFRENRSQGCASSIKLCSKNLTDRFNPSNTLCCMNSDHCNYNLIPDLNEVFEKGFLGDTVPTTAKNVALLIASIIGIFTLCSACVLIMILSRKVSRTLDPNKAEKDEVMESSISSGSGGGDTRFAQRTLGKDIEFLETIGRGSFGEVVKGLRKGTTVAVKIFYTIEESSWQNERHIYFTCHLNHDSILKFIASDIIVTNFACTRLLIVTEYHENGSLYDYLQLHAIDERIMTNMIFSIILGLDYLHDEYKSPDPKSPTAHRDLKSKNIIVKSNLHCCIADFGLAITPDSVGSDSGIKSQVGTKRYMAPEILADTLETGNFTSFLQADIYSASLVIWEICNRFITREYCLPYFCYVSSDPSVEAMKHIVHDQGIRPTMNQWNKHNILEGIYKILKESWHSTPSVRRTALRIRKDFIKILTFESNDKQNDYCKCIV